MKILLYKDPPNINSTLLTWTFAEELRLLGHQVFWAKPKIDSIQKGFIDWVFGNGINSWDAHNVAKSCDAKLHIHLEGVAFWRIGMGSAVKDWGYDKELTPEEIKYHKEQYIKWMSAAYEADSCSVNGERQIIAIQTNLFGGHHLPNCHKLSCGVDARYAVTLRPYYPKKWQIVTASRLEEAKKVFMIAEALAKLDTEKLPPWIIIGYGTKEQTEKLYSFCNKHKIKAMLHPCFGAEKWRIIRSSCLMLQGWSGIPPSEGLMCKTPVISFNHKDVVELYDDSIHWARDNDTDDMARKIEGLLKNVSNSYNYNYLDDITEIGRQKLLKGEIYACTQEQLAKYYDEKIFI